MIRIGTVSPLLMFLTSMTVLALAQGPGPMGPMGPMTTMGPGPHMMGGPGHMGAWWKNSDVVKELQLTDPQRKQIEQTFLDYRLKLIDLHADVERQETKLQPLIEADQPNEQQVSSQVDAVVAARGKLEKTNTMMMLAIRRVLTVDQWKKLQAIQQRHGFGMGMHGRDGDVVYFRHRPMGPPEPAPPPPPEKNE